MRNRRNEWIQLGVFAQLRHIALEMYDRIVGLVLDQIAVDGSSPLLAPTLDLLDELGPLPDAITVHLDAGYDSGKTRTTLDERGLRGRIAHKGEKAPIQATPRWHVERTHAWQNAFCRLARCYERRTEVVNAFFDFADTVITVRSLIRRAWTTHRWEGRPRRRP